MSTQEKDWSTVKALFDAVLDQDPASRSAFLASHCPDERIRSEVERLLREHHEAGTFLSTPLVPDLGFETRTDASIRALAEGQTLAGRFRIVSFIAAGGMGQVYKAVDTRLNRLVAIKVVSEAFSQRFEREARTIASLNHPYICALHDIGPNYLVMEYLEGETLATRIKRGALPLSEALDIAIATASALGMAHARGIVHRDLKPGNIMLTQSGTKLLDFGLAKFEHLAGTGEETLTAPISDSAQVVGTLLYMAPEQLQGKAADARSDIFAFGATLYEMLSGKRAFDRKSSADIIVAVSREEPTPLRELVRDVPHELRQLVRRCLRKKPEERYSSIQDAKQELEQIRSLVSGPISGINLKILFRQSRRPRVAIPLVTASLALIVGAGWWWHFENKVEWAKTTGLPQLLYFDMHNDPASAYALALEMKPYLAHNAELERLWKDVTWTSSITTDPPGAKVYRRDYDDPNAKWLLMGTTPLANVATPQMSQVWKYELPGYETVENAYYGDGWSPDETVAVKLFKTGEAPKDMVRVELGSKPGETEPVYLFGFTNGMEKLDPVPLESYWIDKYEVTNRQYKQFLDQGGYRSPRYWKRPFVKDGKEISWEEAMAQFKDTTGRTGPAGWIAGEYPKGEDDFPVTGVSWYEAAAYAEFAGKQLPTIYHWIRAAEPVDGAAMLPLSNFSLKGPSQVGTYRGVSLVGAYDMAGNAKEWVLNEGRNGDRYILGGGWNEPTYLFNDPDARPPFERLLTFGFRCASYAATPSVAIASQPLSASTRDFNKEKPVSDQTFSAWKSLFTYDKAPLNATIVSTEETAKWTKQRITINAAYGGERMDILLYLPKRYSPPFQTVISFPAAGAIRLKTSQHADVFIPDFLVTSGRAVAMPILKGTFERADGLRTPRPDTTNNYRDHIVYWIKDVARTIDYLETRKDIDSTKIGYTGFSWGAAMVAIVPAIETRIKVAAVQSGGFNPAAALPEADAINYVPHVKIPVLMLNGLYDYYFPTTTSQEPMFRLMGTPTADKRRMVYKAGHDLPDAEVVKETLNWFDHYFGPAR